MREVILDEMVEEIELKFFDLDINKIEEKIVQLGAIMKFESDSKSIFFDNEKLGINFLGSNSKALRLRNINGKNFLTFKGPKKESAMKVREELEVEVDNFEKTKEILRVMGFVPTKVFYKRRKHYELGDIHFEIDDFEDLPSYLEIETHSVLDMKEICEKLGLDIVKGDNRTMMEIWPEKFI